MARLNLGNSLTACVPPRDKLGCCDSERAANQAPLTSFATASLELRCYVSRYRNLDSWRDGQI